MHIRFVTTHRRGHTYRSPQLVQSYRRKKDGKPVQRVLATLSMLSSRALENLRVALEAGRLGQGVVLAEVPPRSLREVQVVANYRFLAVLAALHAWRELDLDLVLRSSRAANHAEIEVEAVVAALTIHRCVAPASKLAATRWYPGTALPELQGIDPARFHNTRIHEALSALDAAEDSIQEHLPPHLLERLGPLRAMFLDLTDTWFEGRGPPMAALTQTKEGLLRRRIGLALLCAQDGDPLRWKTLVGKFNDGKVMAGITEQLKALPWVGPSPVVMDRAMGNGVTLLGLLETGLRFVTAIPVSEFDSWNAAIPWQAFADLELSLTPRGRQEDLARVREVASSVSMIQVQPNRRWVVDLGVVTHRTLRRPPPPGHGLTATMLREAIAFEAETQCGDSSQEQIAERHSSSARTVRRYRPLARITGPARKRILSGEGERLGYTQLRDLARRLPQDQEKAFEELLERAPAHRRGQHPKVGAHEADSPPMALRLVLTFNPEAFLNQRSDTREDLQRLEDFRQDLNRRLRSKSSRRRPGSIEHEVGEQLDRLKFTNRFTLHVDHQDDRPQVRLERNERKWELHQRYDGVNIIVAHPELRLGAAELVELYFAKDAVEKDIQTIKGEVEIRPVRHRTDPKVRAHVTLCIFALLLDRWIERKLAAAGHAMKASTALEMMGSVHLNHLRAENVSLYTITQLTAEQRNLVEALGLAETLDEKNLTALLTPRFR